MKKTKKKVEKEAYSKPTAIVMGCHKQGKCW